MLRQLTTIWKYRSFWLSLVKMDLRLRYRRSVLGVGWSLLNPILMTIAFCLVFAKWNGNADWRTYGPFVLAGISVWEYIKTCVLYGCTTFFRNESYIRQCPLPLTIYSLRTVLGATIHFLIALSVVILTITCLAPSDPYRCFHVIWAVIPALILLFLFCWAVSVLASFLTVFFHDTQQIMEVFFQLFFFLTPILYKKNVLIDKGLSWLADLNPAVTFFELIRDPLVYGQLPEMWMVWKAIGFTAGFVLVAIALTARLEKKLIFRL
jgi:ABC-type polysaccharide/polyol phosphate export permease